MISLSMIQWVGSIGWDQWLRFVEIITAAIIVGYLRRKGCEANEKDEKRYAEDERKRKEAT